MNYSFLFFLFIVCFGCASDQCKWDSKALIEFGSETNTDFASSDVVIIESSFQCKGCVDSLFILIRNHSLLCPEMNWVFILSNERHLMLMESTDNTIIYWDEKGLLEKHFPKLAGLNLIQIEDKKVRKIIPVGIRELEPKQLKLKFDEVYNLECLH